MQQSYYARLKEVTKRVRQIERDHLERVKRVYGVQEEVKIQEAAELDTNQTEERKDLDLMMEEEMPISNLEQV